MSAPGELSSGNIIAFLGDSPELQAGNFLGKGRRICLLLLFTRLPARWKLCEGRMKRAANRQAKGRRGAWASGFLTPRAGRAGSGSAARGSGAGQLSPPDVASPPSSERTRPQPPAPSGSGEALRRGCPGSWDWIKTVLLAASAGCPSLPAPPFGKHKALSVITPWLPSYC